MNDINKSLQEKFFECDKHVEKIKAAKENLKNIFPVSVEQYKNVSEIEAGFIDQFVFRFSKLQDTLGERIFPAVLLLGGEDIKRKTFMDILNRLEELDLVIRTDWLLLREIRNEIAHEYSGNTNEVVISLNDIYSKAEYLINVYEKVKTFCHEKSI